MKCEVVTRSQARTGQANYIPVTGCEANVTGKARFNQHQPILQSFGGHQLLSAGVLEAVTFELFEDEEMEVEELQAEVA